MFKVTCSFFVFNCVNSADCRCINISVMLYSKFQLVHVVNYITALLRPKHGRGLTDADTNSDCTKGSLYY